MLNSSWIASAAELSTSVSPGNTPWPMFRHDLLHTGRSPYLGAQTFDLKWSFDTGAGIESTPVLDRNGNVYVQSHDGYLYALDSNGTLKWRFHTFDSFAVCCLGPESSPAIDSNGIIYVGSSDGSLYALFANGTLEWRFLTLGPIQSSPAIGTDGTIYFGVDDPPCFPGSFSTVLAINPDGTLKWGSGFCDFVFYASPSIASDGTIYIGTIEGTLLAIS